jgi:ATP phosphoribosyltransferase regulatory subunit
MSQLRAETARLLGVFEATGAVRVEADILQPADVLLDLYGEDIRARAYVTSDPLRGEQMLRPDFTVPVVQRHMAESAEPARYTYAGPVFRYQDSATGRAAQSEQVGYEVFDRSAPEAIEAEVFELFHRILAPLDLTASTGDVGLLRAAIDGLTTSDARKAALRRHIWRPLRFQSLLARFSQPVAPKVLGAGGQQIGLRSAQDVQERLAQLQEEAAAPPIPPAEIEALTDLLSIRGKLPEALELLQALTRRLPSIGPAVAHMEARIKALDAAGVDVAQIGFEAAYGLTAMEYYDGFVFGFYAAKPGWPAIASGGRYDALTRVLGQGRAVPAVGGIIRPEYSLRAEAGSAS